VTANPTLYAGRNDFDAEHDLVVVTMVGLLPSLLVVNPHLGPKNLAEFVTLARTTRVSFASGGLGSAGHLTMEYFGDVAGLKLRHLSYRGGGLAVTDVISGQASAAFVVPSTALNAVQRGALLPLAVSTTQRMPLLPDTPTVQESGYPDFNVATAYLVWLPAGTPRDVSASVEAELLEALADPSLQDRLRNLGLVPMILPPARAVEWLSAERDRWSRLIESHAISPE
jgi:tripartite-type tricarboxylate transporter receptor subunit TctC